MSAQALRDTLRRRLKDASDQEAGLLATRTEDPLDAMRLRQGVIKGLGAASALLDEAYREND